MHDDTHELESAKVLAQIKQADADGQDLTAENSSASRWAATEGHLAVVKYLVEECDQDIDATAHDNYAIRHAAQNGHLAVVKYLLEECDQDVDTTADDNYAIRNAAANGHLAVVKYLAGTLSAEDIKSMDDASLAEHQQCVIALRRVGCIDDAQLTKLLQNEAVQHALRLKLPLLIDELIALCKDNTQTTRVLKQL